MHVICGVMAPQAFSDKQFGMGERGAPRKGGILQVPYPTNKGRMQRQTTSFICRLSMPDPELCTQLALINKILPKFCSKKLKLEATLTELSWNLFRKRCWLGITVQ